MSGEGDLVLAGRQSGGCKTQMVSIKGLSLNDKLGPLPAVIRVTTSQQSEVTIIRLNLSITF